MKNTSNHFQIRIPGKWILAGEHAVIRGGDAIVFPLTSRYLDLCYTQSDAEFEIRYKGSDNSELEIIIWSVVEKALKKLNLKRQQLTGVVEFESHILFGAGMGASATLCVALTKLLSHLGYIQPTDEYEFARDLENLFHGESSGVDVAVTLFCKPLFFSRNNGFSQFEVSTPPLLYLSHTGIRGVTKDCVEKVKKLFLTNQEKALALDQQMCESVVLFKEVLSAAKKENYASNFEKWILAMNKANDCFSQWGLVNDIVKKHEEQLRRAGAKAVKLTGSGDGGFMLSLWAEKPTDVVFEMIPCFSESIELKR